MSLHSAEGGDGEPRERSIVRRFRGWPKHLKNLALFAILCAVSSAILSFLSVETGYGYLYDLALVLLSTAMTLVVVNLILHQASSSPLRFMIDDAKRELNDFLRDYKGHLLIIDTLNCLAQGNADQKARSNAVIAFEMEWRTFQDVKARTQVARSASKELVLLFWAAEIVLANERRFFTELANTEQRYINNSAFRNNFTILNSLQELSQWYSGLKKGQLPSPPGPSQWEHAARAIDHYLSSSRT
jgi:hypothetical protein